MAAKSLTDGVAVGAEHTEMDHPVGALEGIVAAGGSTLAAAEVAMWAVRRCCAHVDHDPMVTRLRLESSTAGCGRWEGMDVTSVRLP